MLIRAILSIGATIMPPLTGRHDEIVDHNYERFGILTICYESEFVFLCMEIAGFFLCRPDGARNACAGMNFCSYNHVAPSGASVSMVEYYR